jgi:polar amino acid transport system substrate-binding protein
MRTTSTRTASAVKKLLAVLAIVMLAAALLWPVAASAMTGTSVTFVPDTGGQLTRFTFTALTDADGPISRMTVRFPEGFDVSKAYNRIETLKGLDRRPVTVKETTSGTSIDLEFTPAIEPSSTLKVYLYDVKTPVQGNTYPFAVTYEVRGQERQVSGLTVALSTPPRAEQLSRELADTGWVKAWNSVKFLYLFLDPRVIVLSIPLLFTGWLYSLALIGMAFPLAIAGGLILAFMKMSKIAPVRWLASAYINVVRGTPLLLQIFIVFIGLPIAGIHLPQFFAGVIVLSLNSSAYLAEVFRAGIQSINRGQFEAASSLGMTYAQAMQFVIIPQTVKRVLPTMTSEFILLFKDTALLAAVGVFELMMFTNNLVSRTSSLTPYVVAACYYLIVTVPLIRWVGNLELRLAVSEHGHVVEEQKKRGGLFGRIGGRTDMTQPSLEPGTAVGATPQEHESR